MTPKELAGALRRQLNPRRARWQKPAAVVRALGLRRGQVVAEIGSGPGYFTPRLARAVGPSGHVYAVDPEAAVLDVLRRRLGRIRVRNVTPVLSRDDDPLLPRGRCDVEFDAGEEAVDLNRAHDAAKAVSSAQLLGRASLQTSHLRCRDEPAVRLVTLSANPARTIPTAQRVEADPKRPRSLACGVDVLIAHHRPPSYKVGRINIGIA